MNIINKTHEIEEFIGKENLKNEIKMQKIEDDLKNLINEKNEIIKNMNDELLKQKQIIKEQSEKIGILFQMLNNANTLNDKLNKSINYEMEISSMDKEIKNLEGIGFEIEAFNEFNFDNYFKSNNKLIKDKFIFSLFLKGNNKIPIKELVNKVFQEFKKKGLELKFRETDEDNIFIDFYTDIDFFSRLNDDNCNSENKKKDSENCENEKNDNKKDKENEKEKEEENDKENNNKNDDFDIFEKIQVEEILKNSSYLFNLKANLRTNFLFENIFEEDKEKYAKNFLYFKLNANYDINTKNLLSCVVENLMEENKENK